MTSEYVVEVEVTGFATEGMVAVDGHTLTAKEAREANADKLDGLEPSFADTEIEMHEPLVRDDGTGILYFVWDPPAENDDGTPRDDGAMTWMSAKQYTEHVISTVAGAGFAMVEHRIGLHEVEAKPKRKSKAKTNSDKP